MRRVSIFANFGLLFCCSRLDVHTNLEQQNNKPKIDNQSDLSEQVNSSVLAGAINAPNRPKRGRG